MLKTGLFMHEKFINIFIELNSYTFVYREQEVKEWAD